MTGMGILAMSSAYLTDWVHSICELAWLSITDHKKSHFISVATSTQFLHTYAAPFIVQAIQLSVPTRLPQPSPSCSLCSSYRMQHLILSTISQSAKVPACHSSLQPPPLATDYCLNKMQVYIPSYWCRTRNGVLLSICYQMLHSCQTCLTEGNLPP